MEKALYGPKGDLVSLKEFVLRQGGETRPKKWIVKPYCQKCGVEAHHYDMDGALGFAMTGREVLRRASSERKPRGPGFEHKFPSPGCPLYFSNDPRYADLAKQKFDVRAQEKVRKALQSEDVRKLNDSVLSVMMYKLTGRKMTKNDWLRVDQIVTKKSFCNMEVLATAPWLLPFFLVRLEKEAQHISKEGKPYKIAMIDRGRQQLPYIDVTGRELAAEVPEYLELCFVDMKRGEKRRIGRRKFGNTKFEISLRSAYEIAGIMPVPKTPEIKTLQNKQEPLVRPIQLRMFAVRPVGALPNPL